MRGVVHRLSVSSGGVPKRSVLADYLSREGFSRDDQADEKHHGGPLKAACLFSRKTYRELARYGFRILEEQSNPRFAECEGSLIRPGDLGENLTIDGFDFSEVSPEQVYRVGDAVIEITRPRRPCRTITDVFGPELGTYLYDKDVDNLDPSSERWGRSGFYARVLEEGLVRSGDTFRLLRQ